MDIVQKPIPRGYDRGFGAVSLIFQPTFVSYLFVRRLYETNNDKWKNSRILLVRRLCGTKKYDKVSSKMRDLRSDDIRIRDFISVLRLLKSTF